MDTRTLQEIVRLKPFRPFAFRMNDGREFEVTHPEWITVTRRSVTVADPETDNAVFLEPILLASLHFLPQG